MKSFLVVAKERLHRLSEKSVSSRQIDVSDAVKQRMLLSKETRDGLRMTGDVYMHLLLHLRLLV